MRKYFWVHKVDENILDGTLVQDFLDGRFYSTITYAGLAPSILPSEKKFPEISIEEKEKLDMAEDKDYDLVYKPIWSKTARRLPTTFTKKKPFFSKTQIIEADSESRPPHAFQRNVFLFHIFIYRPRVIHYNHVVVDDPDVLFGGA